MSVDFADVEWWIRTRRAEIAAALADPRRRSAAWCVARTAEADLLDELARYMKWTPDADHE